MTVRRTCGTTRPGLLRRPFGAPRNDGDHPRHCEPERQRGRSNPETAVPRMRALCPWPDKAWIASSPLARLLAMTAVGRVAPSRRLAMTGSGRSDGQPLQGPVRIIDMERQKNRNGLAGSMNLRPQL